MVGGLPALVVPSPKSQRQNVIAHGPAVGVDVLVKTTGLFLFCWVYVNRATGAAQVGDGDGDGEGDGPSDGEGLGDTPGDGEGAGEGEGLGDGEGLGEGLGDGAPAADGVTRTDATALDENVMSDPPVMTQISGVRNLKWPVTVAVTSVP
jgi:hypothetical protein